MAFQHQAFITIDEVVTDYLDSSEQGSTRYYKCWHLAFRGMETLGIDFFYQIKSLKLPINANFTVNLPDDFLKYTKIGVLNSNGEVIPLIYNDKLTTFDDLSPNRLQNTQDNTLFNFFFYNSPIFYNFWNGYSVTNLYGIPSGQPLVGNFKVDESAGIILLNETFQYSYIILEYVASPKEKGTYYLPMVFREALIAFIAWQDVQNMPTSRKANTNDKDQRRRNFYNERRLANARWRPFYLDQAYELSLQNTRYAVKG